MIEYDYISENFLNSIERAVLGLTYISDKELLSIPVFNTAIYNLVYAAAITGAEEYLSCRLYKETFSSDTCGKRYVHIYNARHRNNKLNVEFPLSKEHQKDIEETLMRQIYHRIDLIFDYFDAISRTDFKKKPCDFVEEIKNMVQKRHIIVHNGGRDSSGNKIDVTLYEINRAIKIVRTFINQVEARFVQMGRDPIIIDPTE